MSSAAKALSLLTHFSLSNPEIGLSQLCRIAGRDKATTYRYLQSLEKAGLVEQNAETKRYRIGPAVLGLAQLREASLPRKEGAKSALKLLSDATGETAHVTILSGNTLYSLAACDSPQHGTRAVIDINILPLHATASGICALAFGNDGLRKSAYEKLERFTDTTATTTAELDKIIAQARAAGFGEANQSFESEIHGLAAPVFDQSGQVAGAVAIASVASRFTPELEQIAKAELIIASREITRNWGGTTPEYLETAWSNSLENDYLLEAK